MIKTGSPDKAAENLRFLLRAGLIKDVGIRHDLARYLARREPGGGPSLPGDAAAGSVSRFEGGGPTPTKDVVGTPTIGFGHVITPIERRSGKIVIAGRPVRFGRGHTSDQQIQLLAQDIEPFRRKVKSLV